MAWGTTSTHVLRRPANSHLKTLSLIVLGVWLAQVEMLDGMGDHQYARALAGEGAHPRQRMVKVGKELAGLAADLPLDARSSVFVRPPRLG